MQLRRLFIVLIITCLIGAFPTSAQQKLADSLKNVISKMPDDSNKVNLMRRLFIEAIGLSADSAIPIAEEQLRMAKKIGYERGQAIAYKLLSVGFQSAGNMGKSVENALNSLKIYEKLNDQPGIAASYSNIGLVYRDQNAFDEALAYFKRSLRIYSRIKGSPSINIWRGMINIGMTYEKQDKDSLALQYYKRSVPKAQSSSEAKDLLLASSLFHIGSIYFKRKEYPVSENYLNKALALVANTREVYPTAEIYLLLSRIYLLNKQNRKGLEAALQGLAIVKKANYKTQLAENYRQVSDAYAALKDYEQAYNNQVAYSMLKDSLLNEENIQKIEKLQYAYKLEKKESEIQLQETTIQKQYAMVGFVVLALLSSVSLSVFYYRTLQRKKLDNKQLNIQKEEIERQKEQLAQINSTKNMLFSIVAHDLRSPVASLQQTLALFNDQLLSREEIGAFSEELLSNVESTSVMLDNVLFWAKSQMEGIRPGKEVVQVQQLIAQNLLNVKKQAENKGINLVNNIDQAVLVLADPAMADIVVRNLLSNAIKFCSVNDSITVSCQLMTGFVHISIADTGVGISKEVQAKLFSSTDFYSTHGTSEEKGNGLGLSLCRDFVEINGGFIRVESEPGRGSVFTFTVPLFTE